MKRAVVVLGTFAVVMLMHRLLWLVPFYRELHEALPFYVAESMKSVLQVAVGFARRRGSKVHDPFAVAYLAFFSPFIEETVSRGFAFRALRRVGWPLWTAAAACAMLTGLAHIEKGQTATSILGLFAVSGLGGFTFCWLVERWQSLWFSVALHALMNFWWEVFNRAPTALGGWLAFAVQSASSLLAIAGTLYVQRGENRGARKDARGRRERLTKPLQRSSPAIPSALA